MYRQNFLQQLDALKKEFDNLTTENNTLRNLLKKNEDRTSFITTEIKLIKNTIQDLQSQVKNRKTIDDLLPKQYTRNTKKIKVGSGWSVENDKIGDIKLLKSVNLPCSINYLEFSKDGNFIGIACSSAIFVYFLQEDKIYYLNTKTNLMEESTGEIKQQIIKEYDYKILFSTDSKYLYTDTVDNSLRKWCLEDKLAKKVNFELEVIAWTCFNDNILCSTPKSIKVYNVASQIIFQFPSLEEEMEEIITSLIIIKEVCVCGTQSGKLIIFKNDLRKEFLVHSKPIVSLSMNNDFRIVTGSLDSTIFIYQLDLNTLNINKVSGPLKHEDYVLKVKYFENNKYFISCSRDSTFRIWDENREMRIIAHNGPVTSISVSQDLIVSGGVDKRIKIWGIEFYQ